MTYTLQSYLAPIPNIIISNIAEQLDSHRFQSKTIILAPHCESVFNAFYRGMFYGFDVIGALDRDPLKIGGVGNGLYVYHYEELPSINPDFVVVMNVKYHDEIMGYLSGICNKHQIKLIDLCACYNDRTFRSQLASELDCRNVKYLRPGCIGVPDYISHDISMRVEVVVETGWGLGDKICAMSAAREFARRNKNLTVCFNGLYKIVPLYDDDIIHVGCGAFPLPENYFLFHREKESSPAGNYLGTYYLGLGMDFDELPRIELPDVPVLDGLIPGEYIALQPTSNWAKPNLAIESLVEIINSAPLPVILTGWYVPVNSRDSALIAESELMNKQLLDAGANGDFINDELSMLSIIRYARCAVTPRSATAHIASAYNVNSIILVPDDGENWHLDYPGWDHHRLRIQDEHVAIKVVDRLVSIIL